MSPAARDKKLAALRSGLVFASKERRPEQLLHDWPAEQRIVIETAPAKEIAAPDMGAAGQDGECPGAEAQKTPSAGGESVPSFRARAAGTLVADSGRRVKRACGQCGGTIAVTRGGKYCSQDCANAARREWHKAHPGGNRGAQTMAARSARARQFDFAIAVPHEDEPQQQPSRPIWQLEWHPEIIIRPGRPAPLKRYSNGVPCEFQDDLDAIADHGSPGILPCTATYVPGGGVALVNAL